MTMMAAHQVFDAMNRSGSRKEAFLFAIDFSAKNGFFFPLPADGAQVLYQCNALSNASSEPVPKGPFAFARHPIGFEEYKAGFALIQREIANGTISLINYTKPTPIDLDLDLRAVFLRSRAKYKLWIKDAFVCFSPEIFVQIKDGRISTNPMKGTIDAAVPDAESRILNSPKEREEHQRCVDLLCDDLARVASDIRVDRFRYVDRVTARDKTLLQVSSEISGRLTNDYAARLGDIMRALLPAGSIIGLPKKNSLKILSAAEGYERNFYSGVFGVFDGTAFDSGVMIRFIEQTSDGLVYKSGGGVTEKSNVESEYQEMIEKVYVPFC